MVQLTAIAVLVASACTFVHGHYMGKRDPTRDYYTLKAPSDGLASAQLVARELNVRFEGPIGELDAWYMVSSPKTNKRDAEDPILSKFQYYKNSFRKRDSSHWQNVESIDKQVLKKRTKRGPIPPPPLEEVQKTLNMNDPWLEKQWHLVSLVFFFFFLMQIYQPIICIRLIK